MLHYGRSFFRHANTICRRASGGLAVECWFKFDALTLILGLRIEGFSARYVYALRPLFTLLYSPFLRMVFLQCERLLLAPWRHSSGGRIFGAVRACDVKMVAMAHLAAFTSGTRSPQSSLLCAMPG